MSMEPINPPALGDPRGWTNGMLAADGARGEYHPTLCLDGLGNVILAWSDGRGAFGTYEDVYAQKITLAGTTLWMADGVPVVVASGEQRYPDIVADGSGGAIISWWHLGSTVRAQRVDANGVTQWPATNGVSLSTATVNYPDIDMVSDGSGGAIVVYESVPGGLQDIYACRVTSAGALAWNGAEIALCSAAGEQGQPAVLADGAGGAYVAWRDARGGDYAIYAQRVDANGNAQWTADGIAISTEDTYLPAPSLAPDGSGGFVVAWEDTRSGHAIYAQRVDGSGAMQWATNGVPVSTAPNGFPRSLGLVAAGGGATIVGFDQTIGANPDVYAKRLLADGTLGAVTDAPQRGAPAMRLAQNAPNPFNPRTVLAFELDAPAWASLDVYDAAGRRVARVVAGHFEAGRHEFVWDGLDAAGRAVGSGVYRSVLRSEGARQSRALTLVR